MATPCVDLPINMKQIETSHSGLALILFTACIWPRDNTSLIMLTKLSRRMGDGPRKNSLNIGIDLDKGVEPWNSI